MNRESPLDVMPFFREGMFKADCDVCGSRFDPIRGGVCTVCKRILCRDHLHGSLMQRFRVTLLGAPAVCVYCRVAAPRDVVASATSGHSRTGSR